MHARPDKPTLLDGIARFLREDLMPATDDRALAFRVRIASYIVQQLAGALRHEAPMLEGELRSLAALLEVEVPEGDTAVGIRALNGELVTRIQSASELDDDAVIDHIKRVLLSDILLTNPRFDTRPNIEDTP